MGSSKTRKSWQEKLADSKDLPRVEKITGKMSKRWGNGHSGYPGSDRSG